MSENVQHASTGEATDAPLIKSEVPISADALDVGFFRAHMALVMQRACLAMGVRWKDMMGRRRYRELVAARKWCCVYLYFRCELPANRAGRILGLNHASVYYTLGMTKKSKASRLEPISVDVPGTGRVFFPEVRL